MKEQGKLLTISIPTWNRDKLVKELLDQLISQILNDDLSNEIEIVVSNNGSEDNTHEIVEELRNKYSFISYNRNSYNIGGNPNVMKSMELASSDYLILLGDDDRINIGSLKNIINFLKETKDVGILIDSTHFKRKVINSEMPLNELLKRFYWNIGNAGVFITKSSFVKENLIKYGHDFFNENWSQTQFMILGLTQHKNLKAYIHDLKIISHTLHGEMTIYNSYYLWRGAYFELYLAIKNLENIVGTDTLKAGRDYLKSNIVRIFYKILQCGVFIDEKSIRVKTRNHILNKLNLFTLKERMFMYFTVIAFSVPNSLARLLSNVFIYISMGTIGLKIKNEFVNFEKNKTELAKEQKSISIRKLDYEGIIY